MTGKGNKQKAAVKSKDGELSKSKEGRFARWKEHFKKVLNKEISESPPQEEQEQRKKLDISVETPSTQEERVALTVLRKRKAPGADQITAEMLKSDLVQTSQKLKFTKYGKRRKYPRSVSRD